MSKAEKFLRHDLGDGYYLIYRMVGNGCGGMMPVNIMLYRNDEEFVREITDYAGYFIEFPGTVPGPWTQNVRGKFYQATRFLVGFSSFIDDVSCVAWMVQPDGRYYSDDDWFGMELDEEIWLYALMDRNGTFITKFSENRDERFLHECTNLYPYIV